MLAQMGLAGSILATTVVTEDAAQGLHSPSRGPGW
jgi:hypothetical protein